MLIRPGCNIEKYQPQSSATHNLKSSSKTHNFIWLKSFTLIRVILHCFDAINESKCFDHTIDDVWPAYFGL